MTNTTVNYWEVDGVSLNTYAWNIETLGGRLGAPPLRGSDEGRAYKRGRMWRPKVYDSQTISLVMWVIGVTSAGVEGDSEVLFQDNLKTLKRLFIQEGRQFALTKRWTDSAGLHSATALGECPGGLAPSRTSTAWANFIADVFLADPFFYDDVAHVVTVAVGGTASAPNAGDAKVVNPTIRLNGPLTDPVLTNNDSGAWVKYTGTIAGGAYVDLNTDKFTATHSDLTNKIAAISHSGSRSWLEIAIGGDTISLAATGTGTAVATYKDPWF